MFSPNIIRRNLFLNKKITHTCDDFNILINGYSFGINNPAIDAQKKNSFTV